MSNSKVMLNDDLHGDKDSPDGSQTACNTSDVETEMTKKKRTPLRNSLKKSQETSNMEVNVPDANPKEQSTFIRSITRLSKRFSWSPSTDPDKYKTVTVSDRNAVKDLTVDIKEQEEGCNAVENQDAKGTIENTKLPLSVMEIFELISKNMLLEASENINKLEEELLNERKPEKDEEKYQEYSIRVRDFSLLCDEFAKQIMSIITNSLTIAKENSSILCSALQVIELEETADKKWQESTNHPGINCFRRPRKWKDLWRETITKSVEERIANVPLLTKEQRKSWLASHFIDLQQIILEDLKIVKNFVQKCYPENYSIFNMYIKCYHETVSSHLECIQQKHLELNELYSFLNWSIHTYKSDDVMSHPDLSPEMNIQELGPLLEENILINVMDKYADALKLEIGKIMKNALAQEMEKWTKPESQEPELMGYHSDMAFDITQMIHENLNASGHVSNQLKDKALHFCMDELTQLIDCYLKELKTTKMKTSNPLPLLIRGINSCIDLRKYVEIFKQDNAEHANKVEKKLNTAVQQLNEILIQDILLQLELCFKKLMTKKWLSSSEDFGEIISTAEKYCEEVKKMKPANYQVLISEVHHQFVKEYITQIMKQRIYCKSYRKCNTAAKKIREELGTINKMYEELGSTASWLFPATDHLSNFIGTNKHELETKLEALYKDYPDIGEEHVSALLYFRGISQGRKKNNLMKHFNQLAQDSEAQRKEVYPLFAEIITKPVSCMPPLI
ncbi:exocyst complex component 3-like [Heterodontus francisci]|uniref:exocyst complex component 3-like n=1 Tax=Heterodontus francisci TaxID=7792 RepID=UPI00355B9EDA